MILLQIIGDWEPSQQVTMGLFPDQGNIGKTKSLYRLSIIFYKL